MELRVKVKDGFAPWLGGLRRMFGIKSREASREISSRELPEPRDEAEQALWQAMGWDEPQGADAIQLAAGKFKDALK